MSRTHIGSGAGLTSAMLPAQSRQSREVAFGNAEVPVPSWTEASADGSDQAEQPDVATVVGLQSSETACVVTETWLPGVLRMLADTQRTLVAQVKQSSAEHGSSKRTVNVRIQDFAGGRDVSSYAYRQWYCTT